jgi:hypothetical protein
MSICHFTGGVTCKGGVLRGRWRGYSRCCESSSGANGQWGGGTQKGAASVPSSLTVRRVPSTGPKVPADSSSIRCPIT